MPGNTTVLVVNGTLYRLDSIYTDLDDLKQRILVAAVAPLVDPDGHVTPQVRAWEIDPHNDLPDGEQLHATLTEAYRAAVEALKPAPGEIPCTITVGPPPPPEIRILPVYIPPGHGPMRA